MGRHKSTSAAGTAKEKKAKWRCKQRPRGAEPLKAQISSLIYKRTGNLINKATLGMLHLRLESQAPALLSAWGMRRRVPAASRAGSCHLFVTWPGTADGKTFTRDPLHGHSPHTAFPRQLAAQRGWWKRVWGFFPLCCLAHF